MIRYSPYIQDSKSVPQIMWTVIMALLPAVCTSLYFYGMQIGINLMLASATAFLMEALILFWRGLPLRLFLQDGSAILTAWLLTLALPVNLPLGLLILGVMFALIFAKHLYGGLGQNIFNPAMVGYAVLMVSFPKWMTQWPAVHHLDGIASATPLDTLKTQLLLHQPVERILTLPIYDFSSLGLSTSAVSFSLAYFIGGVFLLQQRIITWHIPVSFLGVLFGLSGLFYLINATHYVSPIFHLLTGASMMGAFFIATDPVTASTTPLGKILYAGGAGFLVYFIRVFGSYPDGVAFAILIMNITVPLLDYYTKPAVFGRKKVSS